jgi:hypothetical protein
MQSTVNLLIIILAIIGVLVGIHQSVMAVLGRVHASWETKGILFALALIVGAGVVYYLYNFLYDYLINKIKSRKK